MKREDRIDRSKVRRQKSEVGCQMSEQGIQSYEIEEIWFFY
jgi:hypothetical protein